MPLSFWFGVVLFVLSISDLISDHRDTRARFRRASGSAKKNLGYKIAKMWAVFLFSLALITSSALEYLSDERDSEEMQSKIASNDPLNRPVSEITSRARLEVAGPIGDHGGFMIGMDRSSFMVLRESNSPPNTVFFGAFQTLYVTDLRAHETLQAGPTNHGYTFGLSRDPEFSGDVRIIGGGPATVDMVLSRVNWVSLNVTFVPPESEILSGSIELLINGSITKRFTVPRQICSGNGVFFATNVVSP